MDTRIITASRAGPAAARTPEMGGPPWGGGPRLGGPARLRLLEALDAASAPLSVSEIGDAVGVDQPRASRLVQQAAQMGLVRREADPDDARRTRVALTDNGRVDRARLPRRAAHGDRLRAGRVHRRGARRTRAAAHQARRLLAAVALGRGGVRDCAQRVTRTCGGSFTSSSSTSPIASTMTMPRMPKCVAPNTPMKSAHSRGERKLMTRPVVA